MVEKRQYLRVERVKPRHLFLLTRVDPTDGQRFHMQEVVAACKQCRCVSRRQHWLEYGGLCPVCGARESIPFESLQELCGYGKTAVVHARRRFQPQWGALYLLAAMLIVLTLVLLGRAIRPEKEDGFRLAEHGRFYYQDDDGVRYTDGSYQIDGKTYRFSDGFVTGSYTLETGGKTYVTDKDGRVHSGWIVHDQKYVFADEQGVVTSRVPSIQTDSTSDQAGTRGGFVTLKGLGTVFVTTSGSAPSGWITHNGGLYHLQDGAPCPVEGMAGSFAENGRYFPAEAGFVDTGDAMIYLYADGTIGTGLIACDGYVYALDDQGVRLRSWPYADIPAKLSPATGVVIPQRDTQLACADGMVIVAAQTGMIQKGWLLYERHIYCTDGDGYLLTNCRSKTMPGSFDAVGRYLPDAPGSFAIGDLRCYVRQDGSLATGYLVQDGMLYAYGDDGQLMVNQSVKDIGVLSMDGAFHPYIAGMYQLDDGFYCIDTSGQLLTGWQRIGKLYYFDPKTGRRASGGALVNGAAVALAEDGAFKPMTEGVYQLGEHRYYVHTSGEVLTGWRAVDGVLTYFDEQTGIQRSAGAANAGETGWIQRSNSRFYVFDNGTVARGWQIIDGRAYYFHPASGAIATGLQEIDGRSYTFREDGNLQAETPLRIIIGGEPVRIGKQGQIEGGLLYDGGHLYYFDAQTARLAHQLPETLDGYINALGGYIIPTQEGLYHTDDGAYYLDPWGNVLTGWFRKGSRLYWADPATGRLHDDGSADDVAGSFKDGCLIPENDGYLTVSNQTYYFHDKKLATGWVPLQDGVGYIQDSTCKLLTDAREVIDGQLCSFDEEGRYQPEKTTLVTLPEGQFVLQQNGLLPQRAGVVALDGRLIAHTPMGKVADQPYEAELNSSLFRIEQGVVKPHAPGVYNIDGYLYLLDSEGVYATGVALYQQHLYYFWPDTGHMCINSLGHDAVGVYQPQKRGLFLYQDNYYYASDMEGTIAVGLIKAAEGAYLYADAQGRILGGQRVTIQGAQYYFKNAVSHFLMAQEEFIREDNEVFYAGPDGVLVTGWQEINGKLHCFDENGVMLYDTMKDGRYINIYGEVQ